MREDIAWYRAAFGKRSSSDKDKEIHDAIHSGESTGSIARLLPDGDERDVGNQHALRTHSIQWNT
jgi:hypothetical protein